MSVAPNSTNRLSEDATAANNINSTYLVADEFRIGVHSDKHDFTNHFRVAVHEGLDRSSLLAELVDKTACCDSQEHIPKSRFTKLTNDCDYRAVVRLLLEVLHTPQLYHQRAVQRKRLEYYRHHWNR